MSPDAYLPTLVTMALCREIIVGELSREFHRSTVRIMTSLQEFKCEICGTVTSNPIHWFVIQCGDSELTVLKWNTEAANAAGARRFCGEAHAQVYISRWFDSTCSPAKPDFTRRSATR